MLFYEMWCVVRPHVIFSELSTSDSMMYHEYVFLGQTARRGVWRVHFSSDIVLKFFWPFFEIMFTVLDRNEARFPFCVLRDSVFSSRGIGDSG